MNGTTIDPTTMEAIVYNIAGTTQVMCSHDGCGVVIGYHEAHNHRITCPHGRCNCTESGYDFAAPPLVLIIHLAVAHSIQVHRLQYGKSREFRMTMTHPGSPCRCLVVEGDDGSVFVMYIDALGPAIVLSLVCVRSATSTWLLYKVKIWGHGPPPSSKADCRRDVVKMSADASSSASPGVVVFEELTSFLGVPGPYLVGSRSSKELRFYIRICKQM